MAQKRVNRGKGVIFYFMFLDIFKKIEKFKARLYCICVILKPIFQRLKAICASAITFKTYNEPPGNKTA